MFRVPPAPAPYLSSVRLRPLVSNAAEHRQDVHSLHGAEHHWVLAHSEVIVRAPDIDFILGIGGMRHGELGGESIDIIEVSV
jgi:hypothetical protein